LFTDTSSSVGMGCKVIHKVARRKFLKGGKKRTTGKLVEI